MKIGKYPVRHTYRIPQLISDVLSLGGVVLVFSAAMNFLAEYSMLLSRLGESNVLLIVQNEDKWFATKQYFAWIFPALSILLLVGYAIWCLVSHPLKNYSVTKRTAQGCRDILCFSASVIKIPALMMIFDAFYIYRQRMLGINESFISVLSILCILIIAIIVRLCVHRLRNLTAATGSAEAEVSSDLPVKVKIRPAEKEDKQ